MAVASQTRVMLKLQRIIIVKRKEKKKVAND
jgi:hypothetical protein